MKRKLFFILFLLTVFLVNPKNLSAKVITYDFGDLNNVTKWNSRVSDRTNLEYDSSSNINKIIDVGSSAWQEIYYLPFELKQNSNIGFEHKKVTVGGEKSAGLEYNLNHYYETDLFATSSLDVYSSDTAAADLVCASISHIGDSPIDNACNDKTTAYSTIVASISSKDPEVGSYFLVGNFKFKINSENGDPLLKPIINSSEYSFIGWYNSENEKLNSVADAVEGTTYYARLGSIGDSPSIDGNTTNNNTNNVNENKNIGSKTVEVPNTSKTAYILYVLGIVILGSGIYVIIKTVKNKENLNVNN